MINIGFKMRKILITGGLGQLGSYLVDALFLRNKVTILDNFSSVAREKVPDKVKIIRGDIQDKKVRDLVHANEIIIHAAAQVSVAKSMQDPIFDAKNNIIGTLNLLEGARNSKIERLVYFSSAAVYGNPIYLPIDELHPQNPLSPYGTSKLSGEKYCLMYNQAFGLPTVCLRPFNIYSQRQDPTSPYSGVISRFIERVKNNHSPLIFGDGTQTRDFVSVHDVVDMTLLVIENEDAIGKVFNVGTGIATRIDELAKMIIELYEKEIEIEYTSAREGDIKESYADISKAKSIGYAPKVRLDEGLKEFADIKRTDNMVHI